MPCVKAAAMADEGSRLADRAAKIRRLSGFCIQNSGMKVATGSGNHGEVKALARQGNVPNDPSFRRIVTFNCWVSDGRQSELMTMDSQSRAFEAPGEAVPAGTPLRCPRPMHAQSLQTWTPAAAAAALITALVSQPAQLSPAVSRRRA